MKIATSMRVVIALGDKFIVADNIIPDTVLNTLIPIEYI